MNNAPTAAGEDCILASLERPSNYRLYYNVWTKIILFAATPSKAIAIPFALLDKEFKQRCNRVNGMLLDRYRLLAAVNHNGKWVPNFLETEIVDWITPRLQTLHRYDA